MLTPSWPRRERILLYGQEGVGKSWAWVSVAEWLYRTDTDARMWVIDTDLAWDAMRPVDGHLDARVEVFPIFEWGDYKPAIRKIRENATANDWFVLDLADVVWDASQQGYSELVLGKDVDEWFLEAKMKDVAVGGDYGTNWVHIKKLYNGVMELVPRFRGHVMGCAGVKEVREKKGGFGDDADVVNKYGRIGYRPAGQERLGHLFHTILYMAEAPSGFVMTTAKERRPVGSDESARGYVKGEKVVPDFVTSYLMKVGKWKVSE